MWLWLPAGSNFGNEEQTIPKAAEPSKETLKGASRTPPQASNNAAAARRSLLPAPKTAATPAGELFKHAYRSPSNVHIHIRACS